MTEKMTSKFRAQLRAQANTLEPLFQVGKGGIVKDINVHREVIRNVVQYGIDSGLYSYGLTYSPVKGAKGNIEYLLYMKKEDTEGKVTDDDIDRIADSSHNELI